VADSRSRPRRLDPGADAEPAEDLQTEFSLTYIFIAHDLGVVRTSSDRIAVMYLGKLVELSPPRSSTRGRSCRTPGAPLGVPDPDPDLAAAAAHRARGRRPSPINPPTGCRFHPRCRYATQVCTEVEPPSWSAGGHLAACHHP
jgi:oligopeptide/dipeptide ABC transporter ATP-binding protein